MFVLWVADPDLSIFVGAVSSFVKSSDPDPDILDDLIWNSVCSRVGSGSGPSGSATLVELRFLSLLRRLDGKQ